MNKQTCPEDKHEGITFEVVETEVHEGQRQVRRGVYLVPNLITSLSMLSAFFSIVASAGGQYDKAAMAIFLSAILDGMDGRAARMLGAQSAFGEQYDSLADMIAFGLAPAILSYHFILHELGRIGMACAFVFVVCAAFRLARFNVQIGKVDKKYFIGLASPLAAILVASSVMVAIDHAGYLMSAPSGTELALTLLFAGWVVICGLLMVSNIKYYSFKEFDKKKVPFVVLMLAVLIMGALVYDIPVGVLAIGVVYALSGLFTTAYAIKAVRGKASKG